jgi:nucleotide-binding universal stress UspA family protein
MVKLMMDEQASARGALEDLARKIGFAHDRFTIQTPVGIPATEILDAIKARSIDLVVMGTHGRGVVEHLLLGSVAERVVRRSPVPVLTMRGAPPGDERHASVAETPEAASRATP